MPRNSFYALHKVHIGQAGSNPESAAVSMLKHHAGRGCPKERHKRGNAENAKHRLRQRCGSHNGQCVGTGDNVNKHGNNHGNQKSREIDADDKLGEFFCNAGIFNEQCQRASHTCNNTGIAADCIAFSTQSFKTSLLFHWLRLK